MALARPIAYKCGMHACVWLHARAGCMCAEEMHATRTRTACVSASCDKDVRSEGGVTSTNSTGTLHPHHPDLARPVHPQSRTILT